MTSTRDSSGYRCTLSPQSLEKAKRELGENPDTRLLEVKTLRQRLEKTPGLQPRTDTKFLLAFLRARKFDQERTYKLITNYYRIRKERPDIFDDLKPSRVKHLIDDCRNYELLKHKDNNGCAVAIFRAAMWDPDRFTQVDYLRYLVLFFLSLVLNDEEIQVNGLWYINDFAGQTLRQITAVSPQTAKFSISVLVDAIPLRVTRADIVHENALFDAFMAIFKPFMKDKVLNRMHIQGNNIQSLYSNISQECLPTDFGGKEEIYSYGECYKEQLLSLESEFEEDNKYGYLSMTLEDTKKENSKEDAGLQGLGGTFKKLDI